jgi:hypothetical protein
MRITRARRWSLVKVSTLLAHECHETAAGQRQVYPSAAAFHLPLTQEQTDLLKLFQPAWPPTR